MKGFELRHAVEQAAHKFCSGLGLPPVTIDWSGQTSTAGITKNGEMILADIRDDATVTKGLLTRYVGFVLHELAHHKFTDFGVNSSDQYLRTLHNAVEDIWIERQVITENLVGNAANVFADLVNQIVGESLDAVQDWSDPRQYPFILAVHGRRYADKVPTPSELLPIFDRASDLVDQAQNSTDTLKIAQWVYDQLKKLPQDDPQNTPQNPSDGPTGPSNSDGEGEGAGEVKDGLNEPGKAKAPGKDAAEVEPSVSAPKGGEGIGSFDRSAFIVDRDEHYHKRPTINTQIVVPGRIRYEVKKLFEDTGYEQFQPGRKQGSLNVHSLHTIATGNDRLFKRRQEVEGIDSAAVLVLDISGSMFSGDNDSCEIGHAVRVVVALMDTLHKAGGRNDDPHFWVFHCRVQALGDAPRKRRLKTLQR
jgi:hypothetical protein